MNNLEHVKGPWYAIDDSYISPSTGRRIGTITISDTNEIGTGKWIAQVSPYGSSQGRFPEHDESIAIGKLLAAAPDLLKAVTEAVELLQPLHDSACDYVVNNILIPAIEKATK
jgi:hypothetical protein